MKIFEFDLIGQPQGIAPTTHAPDTIILTLSKLWNRLPIHSRYTADDTRHIPRSIGPVSLATVADSIYSVED